MTVQICSGLLAVLLAVCNTIANSVKTCLSGTECSNYSVCLSSIVSYRPGSGGYQAFFSLLLKEASV